MVPVISATLLILAGLTEPEPALLLAGAAVVAGAVLTQLGEAQPGPGVVERAPDAADSASARVPIARASPEKTSE